MILLMLIVIIVILLFILLYKWYIKPLQYWEQKQIPYIKGLPFVGNFLKHFLRLQSLAESIADIYNSRQNDKLYGIFFFNAPFLMIQDLEIIKAITIKNFDHFTDHSNMIFQNFDPLFVKNLVALKGKNWHNIRATLSPAFTGSKMRGMFPLITEHCKEFVTFFKKELSENAKMANKDYLELEFKNIFVRFQIDVIANTAFGLKVNSLKEKDNEFYEMVLDISKISSWKTALYTVFPNLMKALKISPMSTRACGYFRKLIYETVSFREREHIIRADMLHLMIEAKKGNLKYDDKLDVEEKSTDNAFLNNPETLEQITDEDIAAQAFVFILGGVDTVSDLLSFATYSLATNPEVQDRLYLEIKETFENNRGEMNYEILQQMKYLDMVVSETLRMWPPGIFIERVCTKPYTLKVDGQEINIEQDTRIMIPAFGFHRDPNYFEQPHIFNPDRFAEENLGNMNPLAYMPFGIGPRNCIGSRFALMEVKLVLCYLLYEFEVIVTAKTTIPPVLQTTSIQLKLKYGYNMGLKLRNSKKAMH